MHMFKGLFSDIVAYLYPQHVSQTENISSFRLKKKKTDLELCCQWKPFSEILNCKQVSKNAWKAVWKEVLN